MAKKILVVDDKIELRQLLRDYLTAEGYQFAEASDGQQALYVARREKPDLIILDLMMPEMGGFEFIKVFQKEQETPIIILTAKLEESDKVLGLELGADDYLTKPFSPRELIARIHAVLRRVEKSHAESDILRVADITLDRKGHTVTIDDHFVDLTPSEFDILAILMAAPGRTFSRAEILERLQGTSFEGYERTIDVHVRNLRMKIEADDSQPRYIETVYGTGYRFSRLK